MSLYKGKALNFNSLGVILRLYFATDASLRVVRIQCLGVRNKRGRNTVLKCNKVAKTVLALLSVFSYHFTTELQRKISTEQAKSLPGNLIDKGILVMLPAQEGPSSWSDLTPGCEQQPPQELPADCQSSLRVQTCLLHVPWPDVEAAVPGASPVGCVWAGCLSAQHKAALSRKCSSTVWIDPGFDVREQWLDLDSKHSSSDPLATIAQLSLQPGKCPWHYAEQPHAKMFYLLSELQFTCAAFQVELNTLISVPPHSLLLLKTVFLQGKKERIRLVLPLSPSCCFTTGLSFQQLFPQPRRVNFAAFFSILFEDIMFFSFSVFSYKMAFFVWLGTRRHFSNINLDLWHRFGWTAGPCKLPCHPWGCVQAAGDCSWLIPTMGHGYPPAAAQRCIKEYAFSSFSPLWDSVR